MKKIIIATLLAVFLLTGNPAAHAAPSAQGTCKLRHETAEIVVIVSGPCWKRDFPATCRVPSRITERQRIYCPIQKAPGGVVAHE